MSSVEKHPHISVLLNESIEGLDIGPKDIVLDGTVGAGGHTFEILSRFKNSNIRLIALDRDVQALEIAKSRCREFTNVSFHKENFRNLDKVLATLDIDKVDAVLLDLGVSSMQLDTPGRGFSFMRDEPLSMTMASDQSDTGVTAYDVVNTWAEESLADIIYGYGEERYSRRIARAIVESRSIEPIKSTAELAELIKSAVPFSYRNGRIHPGTKTFQAIRIAVNDELGSIREGLDKAWSHLSKDGRLVVISFHSLEDRIVKNFIKEHKDEGLIITKKPKTASDEEIRLNPRSRSAKLRIFQKNK